MLVFPFWVTPCSLEAVLGWEEGPRPVPRRGVRLLYSLSLRLLQGWGLYLTQSLFSFSDFRPALWRFSFRSLPIISDGEGKLLDGALVAYPSTAV
jgi:hypothetical protein